MTQRRDPNELQPRHMDWPDSRLAVLRDVYRSGGWEAARAAFPNVSVPVLKARIFGTGGARSIRSLEQDERLAELRRIVVRGDKIDSAGLLDLLHRGRRAS